MAPPVLTNIGLGTKVHNITDSLGNPMLDANLPRVGIPNRNVGKPDE